MTDLVEYLNDYNKKKQIFINSINNNTINLNFIEHNPKCTYEMRKQNDVLNNLTNPAINKCKYCKLFDIIFHVTDDKINNPFTLNIDKYNGIYVINTCSKSIPDLKFVGNNIITDRCHNEIIINWILEYLKISVNPIYLSFTCKFNTFIMSKYLTKSWLDDDTTLTQLVPLLTNLSKYNFISATLDKIIFKFDTNNILYLNSTNSVSIKYKNNIYRNNTIKFDSIELLTTTNNIEYKFTQILKLNDNMKIMKYLDNYQSNVYICIPYIYIIYYLLYHPNLINHNLFDNLWLASELPKVKEYFKNISNFNIFHIFYYLSNFTLKKLY